MDIFLSWSKNRSKNIAQIFRDWLPKVIQNLNPWFSELDMDKGAQWRNIVSKQLEKSKCGIICLTPENLTEPWLLFETGALAKTLEKTYICTLLLDLKPTDLKGPLSDFQTTLLNKEDIFKLLNTFNNALEEKKLTETQLKETFKVWWPKLNAKLKKVANREDKKIERSSKDMIEEILIRVRNLAPGVEGIEYVLETLTPREEKVLRMKYGIREKRKYTNEEISRVLGVSVKQVLTSIESAIERLCTPDRIKTLLTFAGSDLESSFFKIN